MYQSYISYYASCKTSLPQIIKHSSSSFLGYNAIDFVVFPSISDAPNLTFTSRPFKGDLKRGPFTFFSWSKSGVFETFYSELKIDKI